MNSHGVGAHISLTATVRRTETTLHLKSFDTTMQLAHGENFMFKGVGKSFIAFSEFSNTLLGNGSVFFKELCEEEDFILLQKMFEKADGVKLPTSYLKQGRAYICFNEQLVPQGGFALIEKGPFRCISQIPDAGYSPLDSLVCELTAVCLSPGGSLRRSRFWSFVVGTALTSTAQSIIYAVDTRKTALREQVFNHIRSATVYEGPVKALEGMQEETIEAIEISHKAQLARGFLKLALKETRKLSLTSMVRQKLSVESRTSMNPSPR